jgi:hypothetical protein
MTSIFTFCPGTFPHRRSGENDRTRHPKLARQTANVIEAYDAGRQQRGKDGNGLLGFRLYG